jgi:general secretion pathway protein K
MTTHSRPPPGLRRRARGAAILLAMLIMTLVATLAAGMVWLQWRGIEVESAERARGQGEWLLNAALDWGNLILKSQVRNGHVDDDLTQPWATPLADTKLSSFLSADGSHSDDSGPEAYLSGQISDESARYNLYNLVASANPREEALRLAQLCTAIGVPTQVASTIASGLTQSYSAQTQNAAATGQQQQQLQQSGDAALMPEKLADLLWLGVDAKTIKQLEPFVTIYPIAIGTPATINANTAPAEVIMVAIPGATLAQAQQIVQRRTQKPFSDVNDAKSAGGISRAGAGAAGAAGPGATGNNANPTTVSTDISAVKSDFFEVYGQLRYEQHVIRELSTVHRELNGNVTVLHRERLPPNDPT